MKGHRSPCRCMKRLGLCVLIVGIIPIIIIYFLISDQIYYRVRRPDVSTANPTKNCLPLALPVHLSPFRSLPRTWPRYISATALPAFPRRQRDQLQQLQALFPFEGAVRRTFPLIHWHKKSINLSANKNAAVRTAREYIFYLLATNERQMKATVIAFAVISGPKTEQSSLAPRTMNRAKLAFYRDFSRNTHAKLRLSCDEYPHANESEPLNSRGNVIH